MQDFYASGDAAADICRSFPPPPLSRLVLTSLFLPISPSSATLIFSILDGFDSYPQGFDCSHPTVWAPVEIAYAPYHDRVNGNEPLYIPEFQGGAFDAWGPGSPGYGKCEELTGRSFESGSYFSLFCFLWAQEEAE